MTSTASSTSQERYVFIDALRGLACLGVLVYHLFFNTVMIEPIKLAFPAFITNLVSYGTYGVQIFFVLSGFVIAHSLRRTPLNGGGIGRFILRRQLRLDPPYWTVLCIALALQIAAAKFMPGSVTSFPGLRDIVLNFVYLQDIMHADTILIVAWTLCIEVQFYLAYILLLALARRLAPGNAAEPLLSENGHRIAQFLLIISGVASLVIVHWPGYSVWFIAHWFYFVAGVLCYWTLQKKLDGRILPVFLLLFLVSTLINRFGPQINNVFPFMLVGWLTCLAIYGAGLRGKLTTLGSQPLLQYLGRISYSLYLIHWLIVVTVFRLGLKLTGQNPTFAPLYILLAAVLSIGAAHLLFVLVERPSMNLAARFKKAPPEPVPATVAAIPFSAPETP